ncbi:MAG TPA: POTRA domain-containing protein, partial [Chthoniobacterales bacterium]
MKHFFLLGRSLLLLLLLGAAGLCVSHVQAQGIEGATVNSIDVTYVGPQTVSRDRVLANMRTKVGSPYSETTVEEDIRGLYATGKVQNVRIYGEPQGNGVHV